MEGSIPTIRFLPPLLPHGATAVPASLAPSQDGMVLLPCFPLEVTDHARIVPHSQGTVLIVSEPRYVALMKSVLERKPGHRQLVATQIIRRRGEEYFANAEGPDKLKRGALVRLKDLQRVQLNGSIGKLLYFNHGRARWDVDVEGAGVKALKQGNLELVSEDTAHKPFKAWLTNADVGGSWQLAEVGVVLHLDEFKELATTKQKGGTGHPGYTCTFSAVGRARIHGIRNPGAFAERSAFLLADAERLDNEHVGSASEKQEECIVELLKETLSLHNALTPNVNIIAKENVLKSLSARPGSSFWQVVGFWEAFLQAHVRALKFKSLFDNGLDKFAKYFPKGGLERLAKMLKQSGQGQLDEGTQLELPKGMLDELQRQQLQEESGKGQEESARSWQEESAKELAEMKWAELKLDELQRQQQQEESGKGLESAKELAGLSAQINIEDLPKELLQEVQRLQTQAELSIFDHRKIDQALPLQQLIQAETHGERLQILETALASEKSHLEASAEGISLSEALEQGPVSYRSKL